MKTERHKSKVRCMSLGDFKRYVNNLQFDCIWFNERMNNDIPVYVSLSFKELSVSLCPDAIFLKDGDNTLLFYGIHKIEIEENFIIGTIAYITCKCNESITKHSILFNDQYSAHSARG